MNDEYIHKFQMLICHAGMVHVQPRSVSKYVMQNR